MALNKTARYILLFCSLYFVFVWVSYVFVTVPTQRNYWRAFEEFEAGLPLCPTLTSFKMVACPPWVLSETLVRDRAEFVRLACRDDAVAICKEREYGTGRMIYYVALSPSGPPLVFYVYEFRPTLRQVDNGFLKPKSYEML